MTAERDPPLENEQAATPTITQHGAESTVVEGTVDFDTNGQLFQPAHPEGEEDEREFVIKGKAEGYYEKLYDVVRHRVLEGQGECMCKIGVDPRGVWHIFVYLQLNPTYHLWGLRHLWFRILGQYP